MCGRFGLTRPDRLRLERLGLRSPEDLEPRWNVSPGQRVLAVREVGGHRTVEWLPWGLHPGWAREPGTALVNVRSDGGFSRGPFRHTLHNHRCLVFADVFYEWQPVAGQRRKQPWAIGLSEGEPFALGAVWEGHVGGDVGCAILTTAANAVVLPVHERMPVIVPPERWATWLDARTPEGAYLEIVQPIPAHAMRAWPVTTRVNDASHDDPAVLAPAEPEPPSEVLDLF